MHFKAFFMFHIRYIKNSFTFNWGESLSCEGFYNGSYSVTERIKIRRYEQGIRLKEILFLLDR